MQAQIAIQEDPTLQVKKLSSQLTKSVNDLGENETLFIGVSGP